MSQLLDRLREGQSEAQKRHAEVTKRWQAMQVEFQSSAAEVNGYMKVIELETRRELEQAATAPTQEGPVSKAEHQAEQDSNKTQIVRDALAEHPGLTPAQLWGAVKHQFKRRNYVYAVLKRLKDRDQVVLRRGKYYLPEPPKVAENHKEENGVIQ